MKRTLLAVMLFLPMALSLAGCKAATAAPAPVAPGYLSAADQTVGEGLAAVDAFVNQEKINYGLLPPAQQATEKPYLNGLITAANLANAAYSAFHAGTQTLAQAQAQLAAAQNAQTALAAYKGVK